MGGSQGRGFWDSPSDAARCRAAGYGSFTTDLPASSSSAPPAQLYDDSDAGPSFAAAYQYYVNQGFIGGGVRSGWRTGLCDCLVDIPTCVLGCLCPCALLGWNVEQLDRGQTACVAASLLWWLLEQATLCGCVYSCWYRRKLRHTYDIPEGACPDCCVHLCCFPCAFCQEAREIEYRSQAPACCTPPKRQTLSRTCSY